MSRRWFPALLLVLIAGAWGGGAGPEVIRMATTTSAEDSGLLGYLLPACEKETGVRVQVVATGTGKALKLGENGDVDVVLVHSPEDEENFVRAGYGLWRKNVMYNDFIIVGPADDPIGLKRAPSAVDAMKKFATGGHAFVSRGDESGTHKMEKKLWKSAGVAPSGAWYRESGRGMGEVLLMASSMRAYTLTDRATFLKMRPKLDLECLYQGDKQLVNQYGIVPVNGAKFGSDRQGAAVRFARWLLSERGQKLIGEFGLEEFGKPLFVPNAGR